ncbi:adenosylmethionine--8-amino-7-oxononanoate transaminase [Butyricicoccus pullicaecorum]|uniref:Adenosylmethionine-8-amino-7-oxononanoate aminotransferase n=1 Tax=Butyricicoccus pullicaecorum 1.2 TaxID=1203606 RepID=R8W1Y5_9FIRM|nr:adenosylmethionine--8-amino-7-oxononanoate transaminase [Butyricicoccus pullicaecorum]EOQ37167.1 adenosylmethionine-8-amino-7-oxononanoate transaminase [Butyricicoccus pullicaecorum 1.2]SKA58492.1 adenosylmethionine-8-amino-7-oxononanoate aminotransferase [Butyricicoccus pullicaecorum DSM 23266]
MIWYPYQQMKTMQAPFEILDAEGVYLYTKEHKMIDSVSSWWSVIHGYKHPALNKAIIEQVGKFSHVMLGGLTHEPVRKLSDKLQSFLPGDLDYCFFSDSGSVAVEVALKMALQYYVNRGEQQRTMILALEHAYHGDTFKTMEAGDDEDYHFVLNAYGKSPYVVHIPTEIAALEQAFAQYHDKLNCVLVEPLLQGAGGMRMYDVSFLQRARELCDQYGVLLIFDEVATGFGRTGNRFVADLVLPDILVLGKALTGGYIGHAVTVANHKVYDGFYDDDPAHALMHGPTFMGNALACSVALKSIELFESEHYMDKIARIEAITRRELDGFSDPRIREIRIMGGCVCIEVYDSETLRGYQQFACERGVFSRPFLNYLYAMVPYVISEDQLVTVLDCMKAWFSR